MLITLRFSKIIAHLLKSRPILKLFIQLVLATGRHFEFVYLNTEINLEYLRKHLSYD